jgi:cell division septal protein FtsQ
MVFFSKKQKNKTAEKSWQGKGARVVSTKPREKEKKRGRKFSRFLFWLLLLVFLGICAYLLFFSPFLEINSVSVEGNKEISSVDITKSVEKYFEGKFFFYLPKGNFFLARQEEINRVVSSISKKLEVVSIEKKFPGSMQIKVIERKAELAWCSGGVCYSIDKDGLSYEGAQGNEDGLRAKNFLVVVDDSARPVEIGKTKIDSEYIIWIENVSTMIKDRLNVKIVESFHTPGAASNEVNIRMNEGWILKISSQYSIDESQKIIQTLFEKELNEETRKKLDYLDLRVKNKIYYKIKNTDEGGGDGTTE